MKFTVCGGSIPSTCIMQEISIQERDRRIAADFSNAYPALHSPISKVRRKIKARARAKSRRFLKSNCEECGSKDNLTIHHIVPLSKEIIIEEENCQTLCRLCHNQIHFKEKQQLNNKIKKRRKPKFIYKGVWGEYRIV